MTACPKLRPFLSLLVLMVALVSTPAMAEMPGWKVIKTEHGYADLVARLEQAIAANKMGLVARASATVGAKKMLDKDIPGNTVIGV